MTAESRSGFTLLEILVVVLIITILATIVGVNVAKEPGKARIAAAKAQIVAFTSALGRYRMDSSMIPTEEQGLQSLCVEPTVQPIPASYPSEGYLTSRNLPRDPWGNEYVYRSPGPDGLAYEILTYGADGEPGGEGEDADVRSSEM